MLKWKKVVTSGEKWLTSAPIFRQEDRMFSLKPGQGMVRMTKAFRGRFDCKVDQKGRFIIPSSLRDCISKKKLEFVVTNSLSNNRRCLDLYHISDWEKLEQKISLMPSLKKEVQIYQRFYLSGGQFLTADGQGRINLPPVLRKFASVENQVVLVGMGSKIEIWETQAWSELQSQMIENFEDVVAVISEFEQGIEL